MSKHYSCSYKANCKAVRTFLAFLAFKKIIDLDDWLRVVQYNAFAFEEILKLCDSFVELQSEL